MALRGSPDSFNVNLSGLNSSSSSHGFSTEWKNLPGGVRVKKRGNYWIKEVNPSSSRFAQWWGRGSLNAQARALSKLEDLAPSFLYKNGKMITRDVGAYAPGNFWSTWMKGSVRLRTPFNDIRPRNIGGSKNLIFDPAKHPLQEGLEWFTAGLSGYAIYILATEED